MNALITRIFILLIVVSHVMASTNEDTTLDFFAGISAILFTVLGIGGDAVLKQRDGIGFFKRFINLEDIFSTTVSTPSKSSSVTEKLWNDPVVRVISGLTLLGLAAQIFATPYGYVSVKRRKRHIKNTWPW